MFGYAAGDTPKVRASRAALRKTAQSRWPFLTTLDLSMIHNRIQLATMVKDRTGNAQLVADNDILNWLMHQSPPDGSAAQWAGDGGATT